MEKTENLENLEDRENHENQEETENQDNLENKEETEDLEDQEDQEGSEDNENPEDNGNSEESGDSDSSEEREALIEAFMEGAGVSREDVDAALERQSEIARVVNSGGFDAAVTGFVLKALKFDEAVETARMEGVIEGRNQQIVAAFKDLRAEKESELPSLGGSPGIMSEKKETIFDLARKA